MERQLARIIRNKAKSIAMEEAYETKVSQSDLEKVLGIGRFSAKK